MFVVDSNQIASLSMIESSRKNTLLMKKLESISRKINTAKYESSSENDKYIRLQEIIAEHQLVGGEVEPELELEKEILKVQSAEIEELKDNKAEFGVPKITLPKLSKYEFAGILTALSNYITTRNSLYPLVDADTIIRGPVNPCAIAYQAIKKGKIDVIIDRGYEHVLLSKMKINPIWEKDLESFFQRWFKGAINITDQLIHK